MDAGTVEQVLEGVGRVLSILDNACAAVTASHLARQAAAVRLQVSHARNLLETTGTTLLERLHGGTAGR